MSKGLILVGTDRDVGKTLIGVSIVGMLKSWGIDATLLTPIMTGGSLESTAELLEKVGAKDDRRLLSPISFETLGAPYVASQVERKAINLDKIWTAYQKLVNQDKFIVIEGGGVMVPITRNYAVIDLIKEFDLPTIIVGKTARGTLNHCLLTLRMMLASGVTPRGFVLNGFGQYGEGFAESLNPDVLAEIAYPTPVLATLEWRPQYQQNPEAIVPALSEQEKLVALLKELTEN